MSAKSIRTPSRSVWYDIRQQAPVMGITTKIQISKPAGKKAQIIPIKAEGSCREEIIYLLADHLRDLTFSQQKDRNSWRTTVKEKAKINTESSPLKQPEITYLWIQDYDEEFGESTFNFCTRKDCLKSLIETLDALVGNVCVLLSEDRYKGNWWQTTSEEAVVTLKEDYGVSCRTIRWYGTDNFFLRHPALVSIVLGLFRQTLLLHEVGATDDILRAVPRKDTLRALNDADEKLALRNVKKLRPWIECGIPGDTRFPFPKGRWDRLLQLHRALYRHGCKKVFNGDFAQRWDLEDFGTEALNGADDYWGRGKNITAAGFRLQKLGK